VLALMLGRPAKRYLDVQRAAHMRRMRELTQVKRAGPLLDTMLADYGMFHLEADLRWIDMTTARLTELEGSMIMNRTVSGASRRGHRGCR
jgi:hypothetical protein